MPGFDEALLGVFIEMGFGIKAVFFDFMGTCSDWAYQCGESLLSAITNKTASDLALEWRKQYFIANNQRYIQVDVFPRKT